MKSIPLIHEISCCLTFVLASPIHSFYEEALEIIASARQQYADSLADEDNYQQETADQKSDDQVNYQSQRNPLAEVRMAPPTQSNFRPNSSSFPSKSSRNSTPTFISNFDSLPTRTVDSNGNRGMLPPIDMSMNRGRPQSSNVDSLDNPANDQNNFRDDQSRHSASSSSTFVSITIFPKIDSRFLNKK